LMFLGVAGRICIEISRCVRNWRLEVAALGFGMVIARWHDAHFGIRIRWAGCGWWEEESQVAGGKVMELRKACHQVLRSN